MCSYTSLKLKLCLNTFLLLIFFVGYFIDYLAKNTLRPYGKRCLKSQVFYFQSIVVNCCCRGALIFCQDALPYLPKEYLLIVVMSPLTAVVFNNSPHSVSHPHSIQGLPFLDSLSSLDMFTVEMCAFLLLPQPDQNRLL